MTSSDPRTLDLHSEAMPLGDGLTVTFSLAGGSMQAAFAPDLPRGRKARRYLGAYRHPHNVQLRAAAAVNAQRERSRRWTLDDVMGSGEVARGIVGHATLDAWYRAQPIPRGRLRPRLRLTSGERLMYGLPPSSRLFHLRDVGEKVDHRSVVVARVQGGYLVGVKAPDGTGVAVLWRSARKANDYALRLSAEHDCPVQEDWA